MDTDRGECSLRICSGSMASKHASICIISVIRRRYSGSPQAIYKVNLLICQALSVENLRMKKNDLVVSSKKGILYLNAQMNGMVNG